LSINKKIMDPKVDMYIADGCGRCAFYTTPQCKVKKWQIELETLRQVVLESELTEELKWGVPCYTFNKSNVAIVAAFKDYCAISFFKGALLQDSCGMLDKPGESTQSARLIKFTSAEKILEMKLILKDYIAEAIEIEMSGKRVIFNKKLEPIPQELENKLNELPAFKKAFFSLTPGKQRGYVIYFSQPKQSQTRNARIEKCMQKIMNGKGLND
jgi:uncharacterized protein YdeI (YjbR/CyaY-like superfamily)